MKSREHNRWFASFQFIAGCIATILVILAYVRFHKPLQYFFVQLSSGGTVVSMKEVLDQAVVLTEHTEKTILAHQGSVDAISSSTSTATGIVQLWKDETSASLQEIIHNSILVTEGFEGILPLRLPSVDRKDEQITFRTPDITLQNKEVKIPYRIITKVHERTEELEYPSAVTVEKEKFRKDLGYLKIKKRQQVQYPGKIVQQQQQISIQQKPLPPEGKKRDCVNCLKLGEIVFEHPADITVQHNTLSITYPERISVRTENHTVTVPAAPQVEWDDHQIKVPQITIEERPILEEEKVALKKIVEQLRLIATSLGTAETSFEGLHSLLEEAGSSLSITRDHLQHAKEANNQLREHLKKLAEELDARTSELELLRKKFAAIADLIPLLFAVLALLCAATAASGAAKLCVHHHDRKGCPPDETPDQKVPCPQEQEPQPGTPPQQQEPQTDTPQQQYDGPQQEQNSVVQEPTEQEPYQHPAEQGRGK
jgi:hypothetical protein